MAYPYKKMQEEDFDVSGLVTRLPENIIMMKCRNMENIRRNFM